MLWPATNPFGELRRLQQEMNRLFEGSRSAIDEYPAINMYGNDDEVIITAELPGINPDKLEVSVVKNQVTIEGERQPDNPENATYYRRERAHGNFFRSLRLPFDVDKEGIKASYKNGILTIAIPRDAGTKPRKIAIGS